MSDITRIRQLIGSVNRGIDLTANTLVTESIKVGGGVTNTELTKVILDNLVNLQNGSDAGALHNHNGAYHTKAILASTSASEGASLIGIQDSAAQFTSTNVEGALAESLDAAQAAQADATQALADAAAVINDVGHLVTLSGMSVDSDDLGTFTGATISDASTIKGALQALETSLETKAADSAVIKKDGSVAFTAAQSMGGNKLTNLAAPTANGDALRYDQLGASGGIATLDGGGKVPVSQLPSAIMTYEGVWNASTNSPSLADGTGDAGMVYRVGTAGSQFTPTIAFDVGDYVIYNGTKWEKSDTTDAVASVFGRTGIVSAQSGDYTAAQVTNTPAGGIAATTVQAALNELDSDKFNSADFDNSFDTRLGTKDTDDLAEGTNLYHTAARAKAAAVVNSTAGSETDQAASVSAMKSYVATQVATKDAANEISYDPTASGMAATDVKAAIDELDGRVDTLSAAGTESVNRAVVAGEALAATTLWAVRWGAPSFSETAGRVYKADKDASANDKFRVDGLVYSGSLVAIAGATNMIKLGRLTATGHGFTVGLPVFLSASGALTSTPPSLDNEAVVIVGKVQDANTIDVKIEVVGVN